MRECGSCSPCISRYPRPQESGRPSDAGCWLDASTAAQISEKGRTEGADSRVNGETDDKTLDGALLKVESIREGLSTLASSLARSLTPYEKERTPTCSLSFPSSFLQSLQDDLGWVLRFRDVLSRFIRLSFIVYIHSDNNDQQVQMI